MLGVAWGAWHFPVFWESDTFEGGWPLVLTTKLAHAAVLWGIVGALAVRGQLSGRPPTHAKLGTIPIARSLS
jgi:hypothetical protein